MAAPKQSAKEEVRFVGGHRACAGCAYPVFLKEMFSSTKDPVVVVSATGCLEVTSTIFPYSAWKVPFLHNAFENAAATASGVEGAYQSLKSQGKFDKKVQFVAMGGDGGTYDIGLQSLSGAMERRHDLLYVCYNNEAYMNTGVQRSSATPYSTHTTTSPAGKVVPGKTERSKNLTEIMAAHELPYVAQACVSNWADATSKFQKAFSVTGPKFINIYSPCVPGWGYHMSQTMSLGKLAVETRIWPLYEIVEGVYKITYKPKDVIPVSEYLKTQVRFKHLLKPENKEKVESIQAFVEQRWKQLLMLEEATNKK